jgi:hypothetical protein
LRRWRGATALLVSALVLAATLPYGPSLRGYFLGDDYGLIGLFHDQPTFHVLTLFTNPWTEAVYGIRADELRPTVALSYQFDSLWGADNPLGYRLANLVYHLLNVLLVAALARWGAQVGRVSAALAGMLFALLPIHVEAVAWISGRADSIPALFYLAATLGYVLWRRGWGRGWYLAALLSLFLALFSKQSAITLVATLVGYDLLVERRPVRARLNWLLPYLPFGLLTVGYLGLRYLLFGNAVREQSVNSGLLLEFLERQTVFVKTLLLGSPLIGIGRIPPALGQVGAVATWLVLLLGLGLVVRQALAAQRGRGSELWAQLAYFGPVWWLIQIAPLAVTYDSPRHLYLAAVGPVVGLALLFGRAWCRFGAARIVAALAGVGLLLLATFGLERHLAEWRGAARVSAQINLDLRRELPAAPAGGLVVLGLPVVGPSDRIHTWLLGWSLPFALEPPFLPAGMRERVEYVAAPDVFCCPRQQWLARTRRAVADWSARSESAPALVLRWDAYSGALTRETEQERPRLRGEVLALAEAPTPSEMCQRLDAILGNIADSCTDE